MKSIYGYFEISKYSDVPDYDPGLDVDCPICNQTLKHGRKRTISLIVDGDTRSYFYRVHKECDEALTNEQRIDLDETLIDMIGNAKKNVN